MYDEKEFPIYSSDTSSIIACYRIDDGRVVLEYLANTSRLKITPAVYSELEIGRDELFEWVRSKENAIVQELSIEGAQYVDYLLEKYAEPFPDLDDPGWHYCGLIKYETARDADPEVIALAKENGYLVLAEERSGIKGACKQENITCKSIDEVIALEFPRADKQLFLL